MKNTSSKKKKAREYDSSLCYDNLCLNSSISFQFLILFSKGEKKKITRKTSSSHLKIIFFFFIHLFFVRSLEKHWRKNKTLNSGKMLLFRWKNQFSFVTVTCTIRFDQKTMASSYWKNLNEQHQPKKLFKRFKSISVCFSIYLKCSRFVFQFIEYLLRFDSFTEEENKKINIRSSKQ